jgi:hypothetical protein
MENPAPIPAIHPAAPLTKQRHGCLTAFLIALILACVLNSIITGISLFSPANYGNPQIWVLLVTIVIGLCYILCIILLLSWRKIGFWAFCGLGAFEIILNLLLGAGVLSLLPLVITAVLYGVLQIGSYNKGWPQLE